MDDTLELAVQLKNPFKFLSSFSRNESETFWGREDEVELLYNVVRRREIQLVFGESGVGKTSLVQCGLANRFQSADWFDVFIVRKDDLNLSIKQALQSKIEDSDLKDDSLDSLQLIENLYLEKFKPLYLIFDQLEELFVCGTSKEKKQFYRFIADVLKFKNYCTKIIFILREEFHAKLNEFEKLVVPLYNTGFEVKRINAERAEDLVCRMLNRNRGSIEFIPDASTISKLITAACNKNKDINFLQLQVFLFYLWEKAIKNNDKKAVFTQRLVEEISSLEDPLKDYVYESVKSISDNKEGALWTFLNLFVSEQGTKMPVISPGINGISTEETSVWLKELKEKQILRKMENDEHYELVHDSLAPVIKYFQANSIRPVLTDPKIKGNPYKGLLSYNDTEEDIIRFYGRGKVVRELGDRIITGKLLAIVGASGTGKSSLIKAGILPRLKETGYVVISEKPGNDPVSVIEKIQTKLKENKGHQKFVIYIDQFEELSTKCESGDDRKQFINFLEAQLAGNESGSLDIKVLLSIRSDYEYEFDSTMKNWRDGKILVPPFDATEIKEIIVEPAYQAGLSYHPAYLIDIILKDVMQMNGSLPLLSYTLSQMYEEYEKDKENREGAFLTEADYNNIGGVIDGLRTRANEIYGNSDELQKRTIRNVMLRMVSFTIGERAGRKVSEAELVYEDPLENVRVKQVLEKFVDKRLVVVGSDAQEKATYEPAHDSLVRAWGLIDDLISRYRNQVFFLQRGLSDAVCDFRKYKKLWHEDPRLDTVKDILFSDENWLNRDESLFIRKSLEKRTQIAERKKRKVEEHERNITEKLEAEKKSNESLQKKAEESNKASRLAKEKIDLAKRANRKMLVALLIMAGISALAVKLYFDNDKAKIEAKQNEEKALKSTKIAMVEKVNAIKEQMNAIIEKKKAEDFYANLQNTAKSLMVQKKIAEEKSEEALHAQMALQKQIDSTKIALDSATRTTRRLFERNDELKLSNNNYRIADSLQKLHERERDLASMSSKRLSLAKGFEFTRPALAYRVIQRAYKLDTLNSEVKKYLNSLASKKSYYESMELEQERSAAFSGNGKLFRTISGLSTINIYDTSGALIRKFQDNNGEIKASLFSPNSRELLTVTDHTISLWDLNGKLVQNYKSGLFIEQAFFSADGDYIVCISKYRVQLFQTAGSRAKPIVISVPESNGPILDAVAGDNGVFVKTAKGVALHDPEKTQPVFSIRNSGGNVFLFPKGDGLITINNGTVKFVSGPDGGDIQSFKIPNYDKIYNVVSNISYSADETSIVFTLEPDNLQFQQQQQQQQLQQQQKITKGLSPSQKDLGTPRIYLLDLNKLHVTQLSISFYMIEKSIISSDGSYLLTGEFGAYDMFTLNPLKKIYSFGRDYVAKPSSWSFNPMNTSMVLTSGASFIDKERTRLWLLGTPAELDKLNRLKKYDDSYLESQETSMRNYAE